jgi:hypothetical protein
MVLRQAKSFLTVVTSDNKLTFKPIELAGNDGKFVWIISGVQTGETVAMNVGDTIPEGSKVRPLEEPAAPAASPAPIPTLSPISPMPAVTESK